MADVKIGSFSKAFNKYYTFIVEVYQKAQSAVNLSSDVYCVGKIDIGSGFINASASRKWNGSIDGQTVSGTYAFGDIPSGSKPKTLFTTGTKTIKHNSDGKKTISVSMSIAINLTLGGTTAGTITATGTVALNDISVASKIATANSVSVNGTNKSNITITPGSSAYNHKVTWKIGTYSHTESMAAGVTSVGYAIPDTWKNAFTESKSDYCEVTLETYSGTTRLGSDSKKITLSCTGNEIPVFELELSDPAGAFDKVGVFVGDKSKLTATIKNPVYKYGAKLKSVQITINGTTFSGTSLTASYAGTIKPGQQDVRAVITDSRGYTATRTAVINAEEYKKPSMDISITRCRLVDGEYVKDDEGGYARIWYSVRISEIGTNAVEEVKIDYTEDGGSGTGTITSTEKELTEYILADTERGYSFYIQVSDKLEKLNPFRKQLSSAVTIFDILKGGLGIAFGGVATVKNLMDIFWNTRIRGTLKVDNPIYTNYGAKNVTLENTTSWTELFELPELEDGVYHWDIVAVFQNNSTGFRGLNIYQSLDGGVTKSNAGYGWIDSSNAVGGIDTILRVCGNISSVDRKLYVYAMQNSGSAKSVYIRYAYHRIN